MSFSIEPPSTQPIDFLTLCAGIVFRKDELNG